jgi:hypothetical protein
LQESERLCSRSEGECEDEGEEESDNGNDWT